ncbi:segregation/condensation protein A [Thalassotalea litorea]|uniref:Segregation and condensation protein A n=1 Tax=Thalassotalea litorea TaxID=2020715 RepID=A0A5R9IFD4_9GAMM|nr:ScpA family protein [Thalassotalea litorea]TLU64230.1 segregation/condensation protein A [Thalassotalea litorea]
MQQQVLPLALVHGEAMVEKPLDLFIPPDALEVILEAFEGPLDLLLYLIRKQKFDIVDLPVAEITHQYMEYVDVMKSLKLELAAEYLVMAAILAEIKSRLLLPKTTVDDEEDDPRAELIRRLQEYEIIKRAAEDIDELPRLERDVHLPNVDLPESYKPRVVEAQVDLQDLVLAMQGVLKRVEAFQHHHIQRENLSTRERMSQILAKLKPGQFVEFSDLFLLEEGRAGVVVTFLAILELIKESLVECVQSQVFGHIQVKSV